MPGRSADALLRAMPGLHQSAHGGHGKAYQYFIRGFDAIHGADLAVDVDGVPLNEVSNVHAHGYLDLHFLPPVLVEGLGLHPGTWDAKVGDFNTAGAASFELGLSHAGLEATVGGGTDRSVVATLAWRPRGQRSGTFVVADTDVGQGVGQARSWRQLRSGAGFERATNWGKWRVWALAYDGTFESPGALREDDLAAGEVGFYDAYPGSGGGASRRILAATSAWGGSARHTWRATVFGGARHLTLEQNFTGFWYDPVDGDATRQAHDAANLGAKLETSWFVGDDAMRVDAGLLAKGERLSHATVDIDAAGSATGPEESLAADQLDLGAWAQTPIDLAPWLTIRPGLRGEHFVVAVEGAPKKATASVIAPKLSTAWFADRAVRGFASAGRGFRSPDARGAVDGGRAPVSVVDAAEVGAEADVARWLSTRLTAFSTLVSDEVVFDHVQARYIASGSTRRLGVEGGASAAVTRGIVLEADLTATDARYSASGALVPYVPRLLGVLGVFTRDLSFGEAVVTSGLRTWALGTRPIPGGFQSTPTVVSDFTSQVARGPWELGCEIDNVWGTRWRDGELAFASWWSTDEPRSELPARHFTAGAPWALRVTVSRRI